MRLAGLAAAAGAVALFVLHAAHLALNGERPFTLTDTWLIAIGCVGCPAIGLRTVLGRHLNPRACAGVALFFTGVSILLTAQFALERNPPPGPFLMLSLILPMAVAIQAYNAGEALGREQRALERGRAEGYAQALADAERGALERGLTAIETLAPGDLERLAPVVANAMLAIGAARRAQDADTAPLRVVEDNPAALNGSVRRS